MAMIGKVLRMHHREKKSVREIVRATSLSRNTVRKYLRTPVAQPPKHRRKAAMTKLGPFVETVKMALLADARRPKKERRTAKALQQQLAEAGYEGALADHRGRCVQGSPAIHAGENSRGHRGRDCIPAGRFGDAAMKPAAWIASVALSCICSSASTRRFRKCVAGRASDSDSRGRGGG